MVGVAAQHSSPGKMIRFTGRDFGAGAAGNEVGGVAARASVMN
jgi:hypothetical protein